MALNAVVRGGEIIFFIESIKYLVYNSNGDDARS